jgi:ribonuclease G
MKNELYIDVKPSEIIIALVENKQLVEINREVNNTKFSVGDI